MNKEDLLKAVSNIDDKYIQAAEERRDNVAQRNKAALGIVKSDAAVAKRGEDLGTGEQGFSASKPSKRAGRKFYAQPWFKGACAIAAAFVVLVGVGASGWLFHGMGAAKSDQAAEMEYAVADDYAYSVGAEGYFDNGERAGAPAAEEMAVSNAALDKSEIKLKDPTEGVFEPYEPVREQKLVYNAFLYLQTENYDESFAALEKLVSDLDGYFESQSESNGNYYSNTSKSGYCTVRIPTNNYEAFMNAIGQSWHVVNKDESISDISEQYYETQDRLETLKIKEERLHSLLAEATNLSDIITLEDQLANTEYQIEQLTNAMKGYDKQVDYSTVNISLDEVTQMGNTVGSEGFGKRFARAIKNGLRNFAEGVADFIVWIGYNVIEIIIVAAVIFVIWKFHLIRKLIQWIKR